MNTIEQNITDMICEVRDYIVETDKIFTRNTPTTQLEKMLKDKFQTFYEFHIKRIRELMVEIPKRIEETKSLSRKKTRKCKR